MPKKILAFGASNSSTSINKRFARYAAHKISDADVNLIDLNDFEMPLYSIDREKTDGIPDLAHKFKSLMKAVDGIVISFAEHNGAYTVAFKNVLDWISRIEPNVWYNKPMLLLSTSPGQRGAKTTLDIAMGKFKFMNENALIPFSLPAFHDNFTEEGLTNPDLEAALQQQIDAFEAAMKK